MSKNIQDWTWEICVYNENKKVLQQMIKTQDGAEYKFNGKSYIDEPVLGKMLNNKSDIAYKMLTSNIIFQIPQYIKEAIEWLSK